MLTAAAIGALEGLNSQGLVFGSPDPSKAWPVTRRQAHTYHLAWHQPKNHSRVLIFPNLTALSIPSLLGCHPGILPASVLAYATCFDVGAVKMRKPRKRCNESDAYCYWNHSDEKYFFKVMFGDFRERLGIPDKFAQHFSGRIAKTLKLESRTGCTFDVKVTKSSGKVIFQTGWNAFVRAHDLKMGDFLVFKYGRSSRLKVLIFDLSCCEKVLPRLVARSPIHGRGRREEHIKISSSCDDLPMKSSGSKRKAWKQKKGDVNTSSTDPWDSSGDSTSPLVQKSHSVPNCILPQRTYLTCLQKKKLKEKVRAICSKTPIYGCVMKKSSIDGKPQTMDISKVYANAYLPFEDQTILLQHNSKSWEVQCRIQKGSNVGAKRLLKGWKQFARDNNLQLGDLCLFELLEKRKYTMNMHIIPAK